MNNKLTFTFSDGYGIRLAVEELAIILRYRRVTSGIGPASITRADSFAAKAGLLRASAKVTDKTDKEKLILVSRRAGSYNS